MRSVSVGIVVLSIWFVLKSGGTYGIGPGNFGPQAERADDSVVGAIHPSLNGVRVASLETGIASDPMVAETVAVDDEAESQLSSSRASFDDRFFFDQPLASFAERFPGNVTAQGAHRSSVRLASLELPPLASPPLPSFPRKQGRAADAPAGSALETDSHTAIYDIAAHTVYLPDGHTLEAHSGLGSSLDNPRFVREKGRGPTPPNVYSLTLREAPFHGVRALRLTPVGDGEMFGRDGILAHTYMLGASGQSNGCVSFNNYSAFLNAYLNGGVDRLVVVDRLANPPGTKTGSTTASRSFPQTLKDIFTRS
jgi:Protein of unknown function (DUF2778)